METKTLPKGTGTSDSPTISTWMIPGAAVAYLSADLFDLQTTFQDNSLRAQPEFVVTLSALMAGATIATTAADVISTGLAIGEAVSDSEDVSHPSSLTVNILNNSNYMVAPKSVDTTHCKCSQFPQPTQLSESATLTITRDEAFDDDTKFQLTCLVYSNVENYELSQYVELTYTYDSKHNVWNVEFDYDGTTATTTSNPGLYGCGYQSDTSSAAFNTYVDTITNQNSGSMDIQFFGLVNNESKLTPKTTSQASSVTITDWMNSRTNSSNAQAKDLVNLNATIDGNTEVIPKPTKSDKVITAATMIAAGALFTDNGLSISQLFGKSEKTHTPTSLTITLENFSKYSMVPSQFTTSSDIGLGEFPTALFEGESSGLVVTKDRAFKDGDNFSLYVEVLPSDLSFNTQARIIFKYSSSDEMWLSQYIFNTDSTTKITNPAIGVYGCSCTDDDTGNSFDLFTQVIEHNNGGTISVQMYG